MAIGPVQLLVIGFDHPDFHGQIKAELEKLRQSDPIRVIDALAVHKDVDGEIEIEHLSNLTKDEAVELGSKVAALIGLGLEGEKGIEDYAPVGAAAAEDGVSVFSDEDAWDVLEDIPNGSAAALLLIEHHWAVGLRDAIASAGGFRLGDSFISPFDLIAIGELTAEEAKAGQDELHAFRPIPPEPGVAGTARTSFTADEARRVGSEIGIDWDTAPFDVEQFRSGMDVELEHGLRDPVTDVTGGDPVVTGKIALAHLNEFADYYTRLEKMEAEAEASAAPVR